MIPKVKENTLVTVDLGEVKQFSIAATGKAFRSLIDGLYSDKILAPVRELITNGADSHRAAGKTDVAIKVFAPTATDHTFAVRDYGTGMDEETIFGLYTTLFESSKDKSNDQTGMLGLGSKSPFAYTDHFTVEAFDGQSKRVYSAFVDSTDMPQITKMGEVPSSEERGVRVSFSVGPHDHPRFTTAIRRTVRYLDIPVEVDGVQVEPLHILNEGDGWMRVRNTDGQEGTILVQGGVGYPLPQQYVGDIPDSRHSGYRFVVTVPIGTVGVTLSREGLEYDDDAIRTIQKTTQRVWEEFAEQVTAEYIAATTQWERQEALEGLDHYLLTRLGIQEADRDRRIDLHPDHKLQAERWTADLMKDADPNQFPLTVKKRDIVTHLDYGRLKGGTVQIALDDGTAPRRRSRLIQWANEGPCRYYLPPGSRQEETLKRILDLVPPDTIEVVKVADTRDIERPVNRTVRSPLALKKEQLAAGAPWMHRMRDTFFCNVYEGGKCTRTLGIDWRMGAAITFSQAVLKWAAVEEDVDIVYLTDSEVEKLNPSPLTDLSRGWREMALELGKGILENQAHRGAHDALYEETPYCDAVVSHRYKYNHHLQSVDHHSMIMEILNRSGEIEVARQRGSDYAERAKELYPDLFPKSLDSAEVAEYLSQQDATPTTEEVPS